MAGVVANTQLTRPSRVLRLVCVGWIAVGLMGSSVTAHCVAQAAASSSPRFMVATIKPGDPNRAESGDIGLDSSGSFDAKSQSLKELLEFAQNFGYYDVDQRIVGGPRWIGSSKFDVEAKCDEETARAFAKMPLKEQLRVEEEMVQALLTDRFKLRTHHEVRRLVVLALVRVKGGLKINTSAEAGEEDPSGAEGPPGQWEAHGETMREFASNLSALPEVGGRIVVDKTGLRGTFDFALKWTPEAISDVPPAFDGGRKSDSPAPSLFTALEEQLGLKLKLTKEPVDVIVIDSAEPPTAN